MSEDSTAMKDKQATYHDWEAANYDDKFSISYDERCIDYARGRFRKVADADLTYERVLEVGAGTGFFLINLWQAGYVGDDAHATDISEGMLQVCKRNADNHGLQVETRQGDAEALPYADDRFDLVVGHAFLHHLPDPRAALAEMHRVLAPGGTLVIAGEPSRWGDAILQRIKRGTYLGLRAVTSLPGLRDWRKETHHEGDEADVAALEWEVDLHTFDPGEVEDLAVEVGFDDVRVVTEDLTSSWFGWAVRTIEGSVADGKLPTRWYFFAHDNYLRLQRLDEAVLSRIVPRQLFYNVILHGRKPA